MTRRLAAALVVLAFAAFGNAAVAGATAGMSGQGAVAAHAASGATPTQLPRSVRPLHYAVSLTPDAAAGTFAARTVIDVDVTQATRSITLNAVDLRFKSATLRAQGGSDRRARVNLDAAAQTATFTFERPVAPGRYRLALDYTGVIGTQGSGLFSLDYAGADGRRDRALFTQFENSDARSMVPCWDEPDYKARFTLDITAPAGRMAVSNMPATARATLAGGRVRTTFATTPAMSTYLLFVALGDFERATASVDGTEIGVVTRRGVVEQARFALDATRGAVQAYNAYFGLTYPLPKLDTIGGPSQPLVFEGMENWGAIFTYEPVLLLDPAISTQLDRQRIYVTAAHETAHQWFGNLVTMRWWDDVWLNEGFASWMEGRTTARLHPEWHTHLDAVANLDKAMQRDAIRTAHPVVQRIDTVEQANQVFDDIAYLKGEAVIRMLEAYVGEDAWRAGVRAYVGEHAYGNTVSDDLWRAVERAAGKPVTAIAHAFTLQPGVPLVRVGVPACVDGPAGGTTRIVLTQGEFSRDQPDKTPLAWRVPVTAAVMTERTAAGGHASALVDGSATLALPGCGPVVVNAGQTGYYRTLYTPAHFARLVDAFARLAPIDQLGLLRDGAALGMAGLQPASGQLDLARATPPDADPAVWSTIAEQFDALHARYAGAPGQDLARRRRFDAYAIGRLSPLLARLGWSGRVDDTSGAILLRESLIATLSDLGDASVIAEARRRYAAMAADPSAVPAPLRKAILGVVAQHADAATWERLRSATRAETDPPVRENLLLQLAAADDPALARKTLDLALSDGAPATSTIRIVVTVAKHHPRIAIDYVLAHLDAVNARIAGNLQSSFVAWLARGAADPALVPVLRRYGDDKLAPDARGPLDAAIAEIQDRAQVDAARLPEIDAWLLGNGG